MELKDLYTGFRDRDTILYLAEQIKKLSNGKQLRIMEVCGGHTHTIMKYGIPQLIPDEIEFIHGPGCPVCIMPKERIDHAYYLSREKNVILVTLGDMIKVPGSIGSLQDSRREGNRIEFVYSPMDVIKIAQENPKNIVIYFAIGFETTTPMTAAVIEQVKKMKLENVLFHINHITVPEVMEMLVREPDNRIDAFLAPSHVSVITGTGIYEIFPEKYNIPVVVGGFEPVDVLESIIILLQAIHSNDISVKNQYKRAVTKQGNIQAQRLISKHFEKRDFKWRGIGVVPNSGWRLKSTALDAERVYNLPNNEIDDHKLCICGKILRGVAKPTDCKIFGSVCKPENPIGSCMVSSEGACSAYYKYGGAL